MKVLTVVSLIGVPLTVITGFFGMNVFENIPQVEKNPWTWLFILILLAVITLLMLIYFKIKKWL